MAVFNDRELLRTLSLLGENQQGLQILLLISGIHITFLSAILSFYQKGEWQMFSDLSYKNPSLQLVSIDI